MDTRPDQTSAISPPLNNTYGINNVQMTNRAHMDKIITEKTTSDHPSAPPRQPTPAAATALPPVRNLTPSFHRIPKTKQDEEPDYLSDASDDEGRDNISVELIALAPAVHSSALVESLSKQRTPGKGPLGKMAAKGRKMMREMFRRK